MEVYRRDHAVPGIWPVAERILVCVSPSPLAARVVRAARRMAAGLRAEWVVVNVETPGHGPALGSGPRPRRPDLPPGRAARRRDRHADRPRRPRGGPRVRAPPQRHPHRPGQARTAPLAGALFGSVVNELVRRSGDIDVYVITGEREGPQPPAAGRPAPPVDWRGYGQAAGIVALCTAVAWADVSLLRARQPHHGVPAGHRLGGVASRAGAGHPRVGPQRGGLRLLLRAPLPDRSRCPTPSTW